MIAQMKPLLKLNPNLLTKMNTKDIFTNPYIINEKIYKRLRKLPFFNSKISSNSAYKPLIILQYKS